MVMKALTFDGFTLPVNADAIKDTGGGFVLRGRQVHLELPENPLRYYRHGWQSWSLTAWTDPEETVPIQKPYRLHPLQTDPVYSLHSAPNGSWRFQTTESGG